ncbi:hypothetical protein ACFIJ5_14830 [Haloimpatiens sp. FM7330]|uniref:hypothetical protein n=1 Tax=Haloimpatiens sp. FM7330 TaxID=3298610 RepID=UPI00363FD020
MGDTYRNSLVITLFKKLILIMILAVIISLIVAVCCAKYLTKSLVKLQGKVKKIGENTEED